MKTRLLVMNGQRIVQTQENPAADWQNLKIDKAGQMKPGIYNIYTAVDADKTKRHEGPLVYADKESVIQQVGRGFVKHDRSAFDKLPEHGTLVAVAYAQGKAVVESIGTKLARGISR